MINFPFHFFAWHKKYMYIGYNYARICNSPHYLRSLSKWKLKAQAQNKETYRRVTQVGTFEVFISAHIALRMFSAISLNLQSAMRSWCARVEESVGRWQYRERTVGPLKLEHFVPRLITHVIAASQVHFLANNNADLAIRSQ